MGLGVITPLGWLIGALAMVAIWGGVWWGLSTLVFHWPARDRNPLGPSTAPQDRPAVWPQPPAASPSPRPSKTNIPAPRQSTGHRHR